MDAGRTIESTLADIRALCGGRGITFSQNAPVVPAAREALRARHGDGIGALLALYSVSDGLEIANLHVCGLEEMFAYGRNMVAVQNWGNGDFDCLVLDDSVPPHRCGSMVFANHQPDAIVRVGVSVQDWLEGIERELATRAEVLHPRDYYRGPSTGVYAGVLDELRGQTCELGRWRARMGEGEGKK